MCIIVFKPKGVEIPKLEVLKKCFDNNPDGCGIAIRKDDYIEFIKGFMNFNDIKTIYDFLKDLKNTEVCLHFRKMSTGDKKDILTHPFPLYTPNSLHGKVEALIFHNGTMPNLNPEKDKSDTLMFSEILSKIPKPMIIDVIKSASGKFVYMDKHTTQLIGDFIKDNNVFYSNTGYKETIIRYKSSVLDKNTVVVT